MIALELKNSVLRCEVIYIVLSINVAHECSQIDKSFSLPFQSFCLCMYRKNKDGHKKSFVGLGLIFCALQVARIFLESWRSDTSEPCLV